MVSIGTGVIKETMSTIQTMGWDLLVNQLIASSTNTEDVHEMLHDFLPPQSYFRFNPILPNNTAIDEKAKSILQSLKDYTKEYYHTLEGSEEMTARKAVEQRVEQLGSDVSEGISGMEEEQIVHGGREGSEKSNRLSAMLKKLYGR